MSMIGTKTPDETKDYSLDWSKDISGDTIAANGSSWSITPVGPSVAASAIASNGTLTTVWVSGGSIGQIYQVKNIIVTAAGRDMTKVFRLLVVANNYL